MLSLAAYVDAARTQLKAPRARRYGILTRIVGLTLEAKGVPTGQAQEISQELQDSGGESISDLATEPGGVDLVQVATGTFTTASKSVAWVVVVAISAGLLVSFWIPKNAAREKQAG